MAKILLNNQTASSLIKTIQWKKSVFKFKTSSFVDCEGHADSSLFSSGFNTTQFLDLLLKFTILAQKAYYKKSNCGIWKGCWERGPSTTSVPEAALSGIVFASLNA